MNEFLDIDLDKIKTIETRKREKVNLIENPKNCKRHVVILGAGASVATLLKGDKNGNKLPVMNDFFKTLDMEESVENLNLKTESSNFEDIYSELHNSGKYEDLLLKLENEVYNYFSKLELPDNLTI